MRQTQFACNKFPKRQLSIVSFRFVSFHTINKTKTTFLFFIHSFHSVYVNHSSSSFRRLVVRCLQPLFLHKCNFSVVVISQRHTATHNGTICNVHMFNKCDYLEMFCSLPNLRNTICVVSHKQQTIHISGTTAKTKWNSVCSCVCSHHKWISFNIIYVIISLHLLSLLYLRQCFHLDTIRYLYGPNKTSVDFKFRTKDRNGNESTIARVSSRGLNDVKKTKSNKNKVLMTMAKLCLRFSTVCVHEFTKYNTQ